MANTKTRKEIQEERRKARERFQLAERLEAEYMRALRKLSKHIDHIVKEMEPGGVVKDAAGLQATLRQYAKVIEPWARSVAARMVQRIADKDESAWAQTGTEMGAAMRKLIKEAPIGNALQDFLKEQVILITSLPVHAADRVHQLTLEGLSNATRIPAIQREILKTGLVTEARAKLIARTEIARTASALTMVRSQYVGCTHYVWRTSGDSDVRKSHKEMDGAIIPWATAPMLSDGTRTHAGMIYNCRCYAEPILSNLLN